MTGSHSRLGVSDRESLARGVTHAYDSGNHFVIVVHKLLADFDFQHSKVNFYELKSVVARLINSTRYVRERKNPLGQL